MIAGLIAVPNAEFIGRFMAKPCFPSLQQISSIHRTLVRDCCFSLPFEIWLGLAWRHCMGLKHAHVFIPLYTFSATQAGWSCSSHQAVLVASKCNSYETVVPNEPLKPSETCHKPTESLLRGSFYRSSPLGKPFRRAIASSP